MAATRIVLVAAVARNGVIGSGNALVWHLPEDQKHFRRLTMGAPVVMGRKTWNSLPERFRPLPGRRNIVLTRSPGWSAPGAETAASLDDALQLAGEVPQVFVIGGAQVYADAIDRADALVLTEIHRDFVGDTCFPPLPATFVESARDTHRALPPNDFDYAFVTYQRRP